MNLTHGKKERDPSFAQCASSADRVARTQVKGKGEMSCSIGTAGERERRKEALKESVRECVDYFDSSNVMAPCAKEGGEENRNECKVKQQLDQE